MPGGDILIGVVGTALGAIVTFIVARWQLPKLEAEARKLEAEASRTEWQTLRDEIDRLTNRVSAQDAKIADLEKQADERGEREAALESDNRKLRAKVARLESRIAGLEAIFKIGPITPEMQAALDKLDGGE